MNAFRFAAVLSLLSTPLLADEVWESDMGQIVYEAEEGGAAIFSFTTQSECSAQDVSTLV